MNNHKMDRVVRMTLNDKSCDYADTRNVNSVIFKLMYYYKINLGVSLFL